MISTGLLYILYGLIAGMMLLIPNTEGLSGDFSDALTFFIEKADEWNGFIPSYHLLSILVIVFIIEGGIASYKVVNWIINKVRGSAGG